MTDTQHLARLAYQNGDRKLQIGWWDYVKARARELEIPIPEVVAEIERLKSRNGKEGHEL
ncbi:MAG: hypothetical protein JSS23_03250 [Proteobacteria bacterium]|nr:hypothetical protein [Pseudomonadota bacterium]